MNTKKKWKKSLAMFVVICATTTGCATNPPKCQIPTLRFSYEETAEGILIPDEQMVLVLQHIAQLEYCLKED